jgi:hypothetical protein
MSSMTSAPLTATASDYEPFSNPTVHTGGAHGDVDAAELQEIAGRVRSGVGFEISRADDRRSLIVRHPDRDHVAIDELTEMNTGVVPLRDHIERTVVDDDVSGSENFAHRSRKKHPRRQCACPMG